MIKIKDTKNRIGITIHGDYEDLQALYNSLSDYLRFYFDHQESAIANSCYENILGLCYDIRHAFQGDRNIESVKNNHENIAQFAECLYELDHKAIQKERNKYKNGNLYFNVEILYPWAVYYLFALQSITEDYYQREWFETDEEIYHYTEYRAEKDLALIQYFEHLLWEKLRENLPEEVANILWEYTRMYNRVEYYYDLSDLYMEWYCTYWVRAGSCKEGREELLPLLCLELSSITEEDEYDLKKMIELGGTHESAEPENKNASGDKTGDTMTDHNIINIEDSAADTSASEKDGEAAFHQKVLEMQASIARRTLRGMELYEQYAEKWSHIDLPYQNMYEFDAIVYDHVQKHGPFTDDSYDQWLDQTVGIVDWDNMEW